MIPYLDIGLINKRQREQLIASFEEVLDSGWYILGRAVENFENEYAAFSGVKFCTGVANGLDALILSLKALDVGAGDEIIVPANTYIASWLAISSIGAIPVPVEPRFDTYNINPERIYERINTKTKGIMAVNLYGQAAELETICKIATKYNLFVIEDNAQAQGAEYNGRKTGSWGSINATSFYPGKNLGALGDAGAVTSNNYKLIEKVKLLRNYGSKTKYYNELKGSNSRLDELQAAFLSIKLQILDQDNNKRIQLAAVYNELLEGIGDLNLPAVACRATSIYHIYTIRSKQRDELQKFLLNKGIGTMIHYPVPPHLQKAYKELNYKVGDFPISEEISNTTLSLPLYPGMSEQDVLSVIREIKKFFNG